jgi:hypothetical protein
MRINDSNVIMQKLRRNSSGDKLHFLIYERMNEEESVLTISSLLTSLGHRVSVIISDKIDKIIHNNLRELNIEPIVIPFEFSKAINTINNFILQHPVDLIFFTRFRANSFIEFKLFKKFVKNNQVCSLIDSYERWFKNIPPIKFNGWKIIQRSPILDWVYCKLIKSSFSCYFVSDPHVDSNNPLKLLGQSKLNRAVLDFPFKIMNQEYSPIVKNEIVHFVIPGAIDKVRRNYSMVLKIFTSDEFINKEWKLILLGRPIGKYGNKIIDKCIAINKYFNEDKIIFFDHYISKERFDEYMSLSDYIIAPIISHKYKYGKDSGALYDVFLYNKIGIIDDGYYYNSRLPEREILVSYKNQKELHSILLSMIDKSYSVEYLTKNINEINLLFSREYYLNSIKLIINNELF